jgi:hypothetical protein
MSESVKSGASAWGRWVGIGALVAMAVLFSQVRDVPSVDIFSLSVPLWAVMIVSYLLGAAAMWGFGQGKK